MLNHLVAVSYAGFVLGSVFAVSPAAGQSSPQEIAVLEEGQKIVPTTGPSSDLGRVVTLELDGVPIADAVEVISTKANLSLVYSSALFPRGKRIRLHAERITAGDALTRVLDGTGLTVRTLASGQTVIAPAEPGDAAVVPIRHDPAQSGEGRAVAKVQGTVRGRVINATTSEPVQGAYVAIVGTTYGSLTDADGLYVIAGVPAGTHRVQVRRIGYGQVEQSVTVVTDQEATVDFALEETAILLDGIVAVGYGTQQRVDVTGSVASVSPQRLESASSTSIEQALQAAVPGVTIQTSGAGAEQDNLIRIRGQNSIRASNTPLIVVDGIPYGGPLSEINQNDVAAIDILKDASAAAIYGARGSNGVILITTKKGVEGAPRFSYEGNIGFRQVINLPRLMTGPEQARWRCDVLLQGQDCEARLFTGTELDALAAGRTTDWYDLSLRRGSQHQHNLSVSGGSEGTRYYVGGSVLDVQGVAKNDQFQRASLRVNLSQTLNSWLEIGTSNQLSNADRSGLPASFQDAFQMSPLTIPFDENGEQMIFPWAEDPFFGNPLQGLLAADENLTRRVISSNYLEVRPPFLEGFSYRLNAGFDFATQHFGRYYGRDTKIGLEAKGLAIVENSNSRDWTVENVVHFVRAFGVHDIDVTGVLSTQGNTHEQENIRAQGFPNDVLTYYQANVASLVEPTNVFSEWRINSQMGRLNYGYDDRYLLTLTARRDGYSGFGSRHKYGVFPSVAVGWNISNEAFWPFGERVNYLKLRGSYGRSGNQAIAPYETLARLTEHSYLFDGNPAPGFIPATLANPNLRWETTTSANVGVDFGLLGDRVRGSFDVYVTNTNDLLLNRLVSPIHGITSITDNIGAVRNRGIELSVSSVLLEGPDFSWSADVNISANRNEITALYGDGNDDVANQWFIGQPVNVNYDYIMEGVWQLDDDIANSAQPDARPGDTRIRDVDGDGRITPDDRGFVGSPNPSYTAGLTNTVRYGPLSLDVLFQTVGGVTRANTLLSTWPYEGRGNTVLLDYWTPENPSNSIPANRFDSNPHGAGFYQDASFMRLKEATVSLDLPSRLNERAGLESLRLFISARNLWTQTEWTGLDPELSDQYAAPLERTVTTGVRVRF